MVRGRDMRPDTYQIPIGGKWTLEDLYVFPRAYEQCYFLYLSLHQVDRGFEDSENYVYEAFPWQGGYSAVDFYNRLKWAVSKKRRPRITRIEYASPGVIELGGLVVAVAVLIEKVVHSICNTAKEASRAYSAVYGDLQRRKLLKIKTENQIRKLTAADRRVIDAHNETMSRILEVNVDQLNDRTGSPYKSLKILLSLFRRVRSVALFQKRGKLQLR
jgi:hypothetical protein